MQKKYYKWILSKNFTELNRGVKGQVQIHSVSIYIYQAQTTLLNIIMEVIVSYFYSELSS
jgi:hypothetical protein